LQPNHQSGLRLGDRILKVDHAGEHGAVNIYSGQLIVARLFHSDLVDELREFRDHERNHRAIFAAELTLRGKRRCRSYHLCGIGGLVLGILSALLGRSAIAATTVAVEQVVLRHLTDQIRELEGFDESAVRAISAIRADEQAHHDKSLVRVKAPSFWTRILAPIVSFSTEAVIWIGMRV
jgi:ubiquinone biosynthesis monooxygenase Coq7